MRARQPASGTGVSTTRMACAMLGDDTQWLLHDFPHKEETPQGTEGFAVGEEFPGYCRAAAHA